MASRPNVTICGRSLESPGHICAFFDSREQQYDVLAPYYKEGLDSGEEVITIVDTDEHEAHCKHMHVRGIPVDAAMDAGVLKVFTAENTYTAGGRFEATRMYDLLQGALADAKRSGRRVRTSGVMDWSSRGAPGTEELMDYEARVNVLVPLYDCTLLCVYDLAKITGEMMMDILSTHPYVIHRRRVLHNPYYITPIDVLKEKLLDELPLSSAPVASQPQLPS
jgi:hypothetical protein